MFSMMGLDAAYVTSMGRLIGVVSHQEVRFKDGHLYSVSKAT